VKVSRIDVGRIDSAERTSQGFLKAPAYLTRAGVFVYYNTDGSERREWRPQAEVFRADSLASLISAPVTERHPPEMVDAKNREKYDRGNIGDEIVRDGGKVRATVYVKDHRLISAVERGDMREVSCGYRCDMDPTPGVVPDGEPDAGQRYDMVQRDIVYNHVAVVPQGRAGGEVRLRLDEAGNSVIPTPLENHMDEKIKALEERLAKAEARADKADARAAEAEAKLKERTDASSATQAKLDAATAELETFRKADATRARQALELSARKVLGAEAKFDGKTDAQIKLEVAGKGAPELKLDGKPEAYVDAAYEIAVSRADAERNDGTAALAALRGAAPNASRVDASEYPDPVKARAAMVEANRNSWKTAGKAEGN
jgi:uncharacterized protein